MNHDQSVQRLLDAAVAQGAFPSAVAAVGVREEPPHIWASGECNLDTRFDMASVSKILSPTMIALKAIEQGELTLWDTVSRFFPDAPADKADVTILQLMTHTGGFTPSFLLSEAGFAPEAVASCILGTPLEAAPDGTPRYSCMGYILLGKILEGIYGAPLDQLAEAMVFDPLQMRNTGYNPSSGNIAPTEIDPLTGIAWCGTVHDENARFLRGVSANAGVFSDIHDMVLFVSMLASGGGGFLSPATLRKAIRNYTPGHDVHRGLGFHLAGTPMNFMGDLFPDHAFGHTGFTGTCFAVDPDTGFYAILLTNRVHPTRENERLFRFRRALHNMVYASYAPLNHQD